MYQVTNNLCLYIVTETVYTFESLHIPQCLWHFSYCLPSQCLSQLPYVYPDACRIFPDACPDVCSIFPDACPDPCGIFPVAWSDDCSIFPDACGIFPRCLPRPADFFFFLFLFFQIFWITGIEGIIKAEAIDPGGWRNKVYYIRLPGK